MDSNISIFLITRLLEKQKINKMIIDLSTSSYGVSSKTNRNCTRLTFIPIFNESLSHSHSRTLAYFDKNYRITRNLHITHHSSTKIHRMHNERLKKKKKSLNQSLKKRA